MFLSSFCVIFGTLRDYCARGDWSERHPFLSGHDKQRAIKTKPIPLTNKCYFSWFASFRVFNPKYLVL